MKKVPIALAGVAALVLATAAPASAASGFYYRNVHPVVKAVKEAITGDPSVETVPVWRLEGSKPFKRHTRLMDLGLSTHTNLFLDGKVIGGGPYAYWGRFQDNTVADLCAQIEGMTGGYECRLTNGFNRTGLCVVRTTNLSMPMVFGTYDYNTSSVVPGPAELLGSSFVVRQTNAFSYDHCLVRPDNN